MATAARLALAAVTQIAKITVTTPEAQASANAQEETAVALNHQGKNLARKLDAIHAREIATTAYHLNV
jgi:hypothetical protein